MGRVFRDSESVLQDVGVREGMPAFLQRGQKQFTKDEATCSRLVTKVTLLH